MRGVAFDHPLSLLPELKPKARYVERTLVFDGPQFERDGESFAVRMDAIAQCLAEPGEEGRSGRRDLHVDEVHVGHPKGIARPEPLEP